MTRAEALAREMYRLAGHSREWSSVNCWDQDYMIQLAKLALKAMAIKNLEKNK